MVNIVTTNGSRPMIPATPVGRHPLVPAPTPSISGGHPIIPGVPNPMTHIASDIRNSLYGTGSFGSNNVHIGSIQSNISRALSVSNEFSNKPAQEALLAAQKSMALASSSKDSASRATYLAQARQALVTANNAMASLGYGKSTPQVAPINPQPMFTTQVNNRRVL